MKKIINRRARYDYQLLEKFEAGIALTGPEVKSVKGGHMSLNESFVQIRNGEAWLFNAHIHPDPQGGNTGAPTTPLVLANQFTANTEAL